MHSLFSLRSHVDKLDEQALAHPYLAQYADPTDEPASLPYDQVHILIIVVAAFLLKVSVNLLNLSFLLRPLRTMTSVCRSGKVNASNYSFNFKRVAELKVSSYP